MPRISSESKHLFTFVKGLITEATGVTYPENSMVDGDNVDIGISGICKRRKGLDFEEEYSLSTPTFSASTIQSEAITIHEWKSINGIGSLNYWVMQVGTTLYIGSLSTPALSDGYIGTVDLDTLSSTYQSSLGLVVTSPFILDTNLAKLNPMDSSYGKGRIFFTNKYMNPFYLELNEAGTSISLHMVVVLERDFEGVDDGETVVSQPLTLSREHSYNLQNQGWVDPTNSGQTYFSTGAGTAESAPGDIWELPVQDVL